MPNDLIRGAMLPPKGSERTFPVIYPKVGAPLDLVILDERIYGVWVHWGCDEGETQPRTRICCREEGCTRCGKQKERWQGYAGVLQMSSPCQLAIAQITAEAALCLLTHAQTFAGIRGQRFIFERGGGRTNGPVRIKLSSLAAPRHPPEPIPLEPTLRLIYGVRSLPGWEYAADDLPGGSR